MTRQERVRDWIHLTSLSQCNIGSDTCPDWDLAYAIVALVDGVPLDERELEALVRVQGLKLVEASPPRRRPWWRRTARRL